MKQAEHEAKNERRHSQRSRRVWVLSGVLVVEVLLLMIARGVLYPDTLLWQEEPHPIVISRRFVWDADKDLRRGQPAPPLRGRSVDGNPIILTPPFISPLGDGNGGGVRKPRCVAVLFTGACYG